MESYLGRLGVTWAHGLAVERGNRPARPTVVWSADEGGRQHRSSYAGQFPAGTVPPSHCLAAVHFNY